MAPVVYATLKKKIRGGPKNSSEVRVRVVRVDDRRHERWRVRLTVRIRGGEQ